MTAADFRNKYAIVGAGNSQIGELRESTEFSLMLDATRNAVEDAGINKGEIDGIILRGPDDVSFFHQRIGQALGLNAGFSTTLDNGGASQILSVILATLAIDAGLCTTVLCGYSRNAWSRTHRSEENRLRQRPTNSEPAEGGDRFGPEFGMFGAPATHAFGARRHMARYGTTKEHLGSVAVSFREHALRNPGAQMRKPMTMEDYLGARPIVDPFGLFDCSLRTDAAGAVIVTSVDRAKDLPRAPALITGYGTHNNLRGWFADDNMVHTAARQSSAKAYAMAGLGPQDVDAFEVYDCFTYMVIAQLEDYGFCEKGEGGPFAASGALRLDGALPTNTSGGQLSEGHAEGVLQVVEAVRQVRHDHEPDRQVPDANVVAVSGHGGATVCHSSLILTHA